MYNTVTNCNAIPYPLVRVLFGQIHIDHCVHTGEVLGGSKGKLDNFLTEKLTSPRAATSVATSTRILPVAKSSAAFSRCFNVRSLRGN